MRLAGDPGEGRRRVPRTLGGVIYLVVVALTGLGLLIVAFGPWRRGIALMGIALLLAAGMRLLLSERESGMLRVRRRWADVLMLVLAGSGLVTLAVVVPRP